MCIVYFYNAKSTLIWLANRMSTNMSVKLIFIHSFIKHFCQQIFFLSNAKHIESMNARSH